ncbi:hypothetical protein KCP73_27090 (plasmid) [Salmonella enterica subsp. enterica]|nr:hypothetical protein KCP73_27090 [Salmonella enterica subsp. enterica]
MPTTTGRKAEDARDHRSRSAVKAGAGWTFDVKNGPETTGRRRIMPFK